MTTVYVVMVDERHTDTEPEVFTTAEAAVDFARKTAAEFASDPSEIEEEDYDGWLYCAGWGSESDCVWVLAKTVRDA